MKKVSKRTVGKLVLIFFVLVTLSLTSFINNSAFTKKLGFNFNDCNDVIEGVYLLKSCEDGRFKIKIEKKEDLYTYGIWDQKSVIARGDLVILKEDSIVYFIFGKIEGIFDKKSIKIQNYGNSMNEYIHFTQCDEKYLSFEKM